MSQWMAFNYYYFLPRLGKVTWPVHHHHHHAPNTRAAPWTSLSLFNTLFVAFKDTRAACKGGEDPAGKGDRRKTNTWRWCKVCLRSWGRPDWARSAVTDQGHQIQMDWIFHQDDRMTNSTATVKGDGGMEGGTFVHNIGERRASLLLKDF
jgi:hypothetical protein